MNGDPRIRWLLGLILVVGALLRLTYLLETRQAPDFDLPQFESQYHDYWARALVTGDWTPPEGVTDPEIRQRPYFRPPGYPWFLAGVYTVFGSGYVMPRVVQMVLGLLTCVLLFALGRRWDGAATGLFAAALAAVYWLFVFFEAEFMEPPLLIVLFLAVLTWLSQTTHQSWAVRRALIAGLALGSAILIRPNAAVLLPVLLLWTIWATRGRGTPFKTTWKPASVFAATALLVTFTATLRNAATADDPVWVTSNAGINLFVGSHPEGDGYTPGVAELGEISGLEGWDSFDHPKIATAVERLAGRPMKDSEVSRFFVGRAIRNAAEDPWQVVKLTARKLVLFWGPAEVSNNKVLFYERQSSPTLSMSPGFATILALAVVGLIWLAAERHRLDAPTRRLTVLLVLFVAAYSASFLPFFVAARFRAPIIPVLMLFAGAALSRLWQALRERRWKQLVTLALFFAALRAVAGVHWIPYEDDLALWHWRRGLLWEAKGDLGRAIGEYRACLDAEPEYGDARLSLATALAASGDPQAAISEYRIVLGRGAPRSPSAKVAITAHNNLAMLLAGSGDVATARSHWEAALALDPERVSVLGNLAFALATSEPRDPERAVALAERACELTDYRDPRLLAALETARKALNDGGLVPP